MKQINLGRQQLPSQYDNLPKYITNNPIYQAHKTRNNEGSESKRIKYYLLPNKNKKSVDLRCCLNLMMKGYDKWKSSYYGVDISRATIELLKVFVSQNNIKVGALICSGYSKY